MGLPFFNENDSLQSDAAVTVLIQEMENLWGYCQRTEKGVVRPEWV